MTLRAARKATATVPIVIAAVDFAPIARGYIASLAKPGGNVTGVVLRQIELTGKRMQVPVGRAARSSASTRGRIAPAWRACCRPRWSGRGRANAIREAWQLEAVVVENYLGAHHRLRRPAPRCHMLGIAHRRGEAGAPPEWI